MCTFIRFEISNNNNNSEINLFNIICLIKMWDEHPDVVENNKNDRIMIRRKTKMTMKILDTCLKHQQIM